MGEIGLNKRISRKRVIISSIINRYVLLSPLISFLLIFETSSFTISPVVQSGLYDSLIFILLILSSIISISGFIFGIQSIKNFNKKIFPIASICINLLIIIFHIVLISII